MDDPSTAGTGAVPEDHGQIHARYAELVTRAFERGLLDPPAYSEQLRLLEAAGSEGEMRRIVQEMPLGGMSPASKPLPGPASGAGPGSLSGSVAAAPSGRGSMDAVDLALLHSRARKVRGSSKSRFTAIVAVVVVFVALVVMGVVLALSVHGSGTGSSSMPAAGTPAPGVTAWLPSRSES